MINIRPATQKDTPSLVQLMRLVLDEFIFIFMGREDTQEATDFLTHFVGQRNNQFSYENCWVAEEDQNILGVINIYNGADVEQLNAPIKKYIEQHYQYHSTSDPETEAGEYYIDTLAVAQDQQGKGIGSQLLQRAIDHYTTQGTTLGLLVDVDNPKAEKLYLKMGFIPKGFKTLSGLKFKHLQKVPQ